MEAEAEAEAEVGELEAEVDAEAEAEAEAAGAKAEARTLTKAASTFGARLAINQANADAEAAAAKLVQALAEDAKAEAGLLEAPTLDETGELEQEAPTLDETGEPTFDVPTLTRPPEQELELAKLDASVARDVQAELTKMDAQDVQSALAASKFEQAVALDSQQAAQGQQAQGQQAAQALEAAIGARSLAERQRAVLVAEAEPEGETRPTEQQAAMQEGYAELMSEPSAAEVALRQKRALQQKWRKAEAEGYSR